MRVVAAEAEDQKQMRMVREKQLAEARDQASMRSAQLLERDNTILNQRLDILRVEERNREMEERVRRAEDAAMTATQELWDKRFEIAKEELREEMRNILSSAASSTDQRMQSQNPTEIFHLSLHEECQCKNYVEMFRSFISRI